MIDRAIDVVPQARTERRLRPIDRRLEGPPMHRLPVLVAAALGCCTTLPAFAHMTATPHGHAGDGWGILAVVALTAAAAWLDRRRP
jgi:hypothetical protein